MSEKNTNAPTAFSSKMQPSLVQAACSDEEGGGEDGQGFQIKRLKRRTLKRPQTYNEDSSVGANSQPTRPGRAIDSDRDDGEPGSRTKKKRDEDDESFTLKQEKVNRMKKMKRTGRKKDAKGDSDFSADSNSDIEDQVSKESLENADRKRKKQKKVNFQQSQDNEVI